MRWTGISALVLTGSLALVATGCGSSTTPGGQAGSSTTAPTTTPTTTSAAPTTIATIASPTGAGTFGTEPPPVTVPTGPPPTVLESADLITGTGPAAKAGDTVTVQYVLVDYATDKEIQASWTSNMPFSFTLDATPEQVIKGWDEGVVGMKVGGRRELIIPPALAYGDDPPPNSGIESNATLIFVVDLLKIG
jgi:peptidylprolyl isomerase